MTHNICHIQRHDNSESHKKTLTLLKNQPSVSEKDSKKFAEFKKRKDLIKIAELRIIMFILEHSLPFSIIEALIALIKVVVPDSKIVEEQKPLKHVISNLKKKHTIILLKF